MEDLLRSLPQSFPHTPSAGFSQDTPWRAVPGAGSELGWPPAHGGGHKSQSHSAGRAEAPAENRGAF